MHNFNTNELHLFAAYEKGSQVHDLDLHGVCLAARNMRSIHGHALNLRSADLRQTDLSGAILRICALDSARAESACLDGARLEDSSAAGADFCRASFHGAYLTETSFSRAILRQAIFDDAEGDGIDFRGADLSSASLKGVRFDEADFRGADLRGADLSGGRFHLADFRGALLAAARFGDADCRGALFDSGEGPYVSVRIDEDYSRPPNPAGAAVLTELLAAFPDVISGGSPAQMMDRFQNLIDKLAASAGYSADQRQALIAHMMDLTIPGGLDQERLKRMIEVDSGSSELPEELKAWMEPLMKTIFKERQT